MLQQGSELLPQVLMTETSWERMRGLLGHGSLPIETGMLFSPCGSLHTLGMRFALYIVYFDVNWQVLRIVRNLKPWQFSFGGWRARAALEMQSGWFDFDRLQTNMPVTFA